MARRVDQEQADTFYEMGSVNWYVADALNDLLVTLQKNGAPQATLIAIAHRRDEIWENCRRDAMAFLKAHMGNPPNDTPWPSKQAIATEGE